MKFTDRVPIEGTRVTTDGYLVADAKVARTGIQLYAGAELGRPERSVVRVYRPEDAVFNAASMASFAHKPITLHHPKEDVTADNFKSLSVGIVGNEVARDGDYVRVPLVVMDATAIGRIESGTRELSAGYSCELEWRDGVTEDGSAYDAVQKDIRINHVAVVPSARAGSEARIGDDAGQVWGASPIAVVRTADMKKERVMTDKPLKTVVVDGYSIDTTDQGAQAIANLQKKLSDGVAEISRLQDAHAKAIEAKDAELASRDATIAARDADLAKKDAEIEGLKTKIPDAAALDSLAQARGDLIARAKSVAPDVETAGLSDAAIRRAVVVAKLGDAAIKDKSDAYVDARFDVLVEDAAGTEQLRGAVADSRKQPNAGDVRQKSYDAFNNSVADLNAWRNAG